MRGIGDIPRERRDSVEPADGPLQRIAVTRVDREPPASLGQRTRQREPETRDAPVTIPFISGRSRGAVAGDHTVVVDSQELDRVAHVVVRLDAASAEAGLARKDRVVVDPSCGMQLVPHGLRKSDVEHMVAVEMSDLLSVEGERRTHPENRFLPRLRATR